MTLSKRRAVYQHLKQYNNSLNNNKLLEIKPNNVYELNIWINTEIKPDDAFALEKFMRVYTSWYRRRLGDDNITTI